VPDGEVLGPVKVIALEPVYAAPAKVLALTPLTWSWRVGPPKATPAIWLPGFDTTKVLALLTDTVVLALVDVLPAASVTTV